MVRVLLLLCSYLLNNYGLRKEERKRKELTVSFQGGVLKSLEDVMSRVAFGENWGEDLKDINDEGEIL